MSWWRSLEVKYFLVLFPFFAVSISNFNRQDRKSLPFSPEIPTIQWENLNHSVLTYSSSCQEIQLFQSVAGRFAIETVSVNGDRGKREKRGEHPRRTTPRR